MVAHSRTTLGAHGLRPLGLPRLADVELDAHGLPCAVLRGRRLRAVTRIEEVWRVMDGWWREDKLARTYVRVLLDDGRLVTLFRDEFASEHWYEQRY